MHLGIHSTCFPPDEHLALIQSFLRQLLLCWWEHHLWHDGFVDCDAKGLDTLFPCPYCDLALPKFYEGKQTKTHGWIIRRSKTYHLKMKCTSAKAKKQTSLYRYWLDALKKHKKFFSKARGTRASVKGMRQNKYWEKKRRMAIDNGHEPAWIELKYYRNKGIYVCKTCRRSLTIMGKYANKKCNVCPHSSTPNNHIQMAPGPVFWTLAKQQKITQQCYKTLEINRADQKSIQDGLKPWKRASSKTSA